MAEAPKTERSNKKRTVTRKINQIKQLLAEEAAIDDIKNEANALKTIFRSFMEIHEAYQATLENDKDIDESDEYFTEIQHNYMKLLSDVKSNANEDDTCSSTSSAKSEGVTREEIQCLVNLPRLRLEPFDGDPLKYHTFMAVFDQNVGSLPSGDGAKLSRLLEYTTGGARDAIRKCSLLGEKEGYQKAREILKTRFGNDYIIMERIIEA